MKLPMSIRNVDKKIQAIRLRKQNKTYKEIIETLHIAKSTLSGWIRSEIPFEKEKVIRTITLAKGKQLVIRFNKLRGERIKNQEKQAQRKYSQQVYSFSQKALFWIGMGLYMAEGGKTERYQAKFYNSNPTLNIIMLKFFRQICHVPISKIRVQLVLHPKINEKAAKKYWSKILKISLTQFNRASYAITSASKHIRPSNRLPFGTVQLSASGKEYVNMIRGWALGIAQAVV